jgi:hypothetical protein
MKRRRRFINFLVKQNIKVEYRTKMLNSYRSYLNTGNAEKLLNQNVEVLSDVLHENRMNLKKM